MDIADETISQLQLSKVLGIAPVKVRQLTSEKVFWQDSEKRYPLGNSVQRYLQYRLTKYGSRD